MQPNEPSHEPSVPVERPRRVRHKRKRPKFGLLFGLLIVICLAIAGMAPRMAQDRKLDESVQESKSQVTTVTTVKLQMTPGESEVTLPSNLQAINTTTINARTSGYVRKRYVDIGSKVKAGDVLAEIESPEVDQQVMQSQAQVANAQAAVGQAQANYSRSLASTSGARSDYVRYQANLEGAKADLSHLHARYSQAQSAVDVAQARLIQAQKKLDGMRAELERAKVERHLAEVTLKRWKELEKSDAVSGQDVDEKQSIYDASMTRVTAAQADVNSSEADVQAAQQTVRGARADVLAASADITSGEQRIQAAKAAIGTSQANIDAALAASRASQSEIVAAQATVASNESAVRRYAAVQSFEKVVAPFAGVITARNVDEGDLVGATPGGSGASDQLSTVTKTGLFGLARTDTIRAQANVPEDAVGLIRNGQRAEITTREYQGKVFVGQVFNVSGALDATSRTLLVEASIPNPLGLLKPGMYGQIRFVGAKTASIVRIPANTLIFDAKGTRVAVVGQDNTVHFVTVKVGRDYGKELEILNGLHGDEILITNPDETLEEGQKVKPVAKPL